MCNFTLCIHTPKIWHAAHHPLYCFPKYKTSLKYTTVYKDFLWDIPVTLIFSFNAVLLFSTCSTGTRYSNSTHPDQYNCCLFARNIELHTTFCVLWSAHNTNKLVFQAMPHSNITFFKVYWLLLFPVIDFKTGFLSSIM